MVGIEWVVDATGCNVESLRDAPTLERLFSALVDAARLTPVAPAAWHRFPNTGGLTGLQATGRVTSDLSHVPRAREPLPQRVPAVSRAPNGSLNASSAASSGHRRSASDASSARTAACLHPRFARLRPGPHEPHGGRLSQLRRTLEFRLVWIRSDRVSPLPLDCCPARRGPRTGGDGQ